MDDIEELQQIEGLNVWAKDQEILEQQALTELNNLSKGIVEEEKESGSDAQLDKQPTTDLTLNIETYIKRQCELGHKRLQKNAEAPKTNVQSIAEKISKCQNKKNHISIKRKKHETTIIQESDNRKKQKGINSDSDYIPTEDESDYEYTSKDRVISRKRERVKVIKLKDDGTASNYTKRINKYEAETCKLTDCIEDIELAIDFKLPLHIYKRLYNHQIDALLWLWQLHKKGAGGLLGDDMGLGKTVQLITFFYALKYSSIKSNKCGDIGPAIIVCPSTVIYQWVQHFHKWAPEFRVAILHNSGSFTGNINHLLKEMKECKGIIITTYQSILKYKSSLLAMKWDYLVLDEGHKIRNPSTKICIAVKEFKTPHRIILSGSPMQNNLQELWSLFDFINPGLLGTSQVFIEHFANPIMHGGYANSTPMQEALALSMATALKNMISPYLLRRTKTEVKLELALPNRAEQVLFCTLTDEQKELYKAFLLSADMKNLLQKDKGKRFYDYTNGTNILNSITTLRKVCNHPDLFLNSEEYGEELEDNKVTKCEQDANFYKRSGKMIVMSALLKMWKKQAHRVLLFTQSRSMVKIIEDYLVNNDYTYLKMDGQTSIASRQSLIDKFNNDPSLYVFLLTTRVGGLGVNLTGADRVIIYDPDWNPATDTQAMERAWRIGQEKQVTIYRLLTAGTIEEKIYQRQVWKQLLSNKVLLDPKTRQFFKTSDLQDLFSLQEEFHNPETANIFKNSTILLEAKRKEKEKRKKKSANGFTDEKIKAMKEKAALIAKQISLNANTILRNRMKRDKQEIEDDEANKFDDCKTDISFSKALVISEKASELYNDVKINKQEEDKAAKEYKTLSKVFAKENTKLEVNNLIKKEAKSFNRTSLVEGERIDGLVKSEKLKTKKKSKETNGEHDDYILTKLLSKKEISTALQHDKIVKCGYQAPKSIKVHNETKIRTDLALKALRKSTLHK